tara:strand:+ start:172 stop:474 length:303 start_codon:yes stop_codon:yes gene_type:complete
MLITFLIFTKLFYPNQLRLINEKKKINNLVEYKNSVMLNVIWFCLLVVFLLLNIVPAVLIANECSKGNILNLVLSFLFSDIYIFNYAIRKFVFRDNYCTI